MRLYVPLTKAEFDALVRLALAERRRPQDQAARLIAEALNRPPPDDSSIPSASEEWREVQVPDAA